MITTDTVHPPVHTPEHGEAHTAAAIYRFGADEVAATDHTELTRRLALARADKTRPMCACTSVGVPMYIARCGTGLIVKRMPGTGAQHTPACGSYEPPPELSGYAQVAGDAIDEQTDTTALRLGFALSTKAGAAPPPPPTGDGEAHTAEADPTKLTLRALLHYLWDQAGFTRWSPGMDGKRHWSVLHHHLIAAADGKTAKRAPLSANLYVPEPFRVADKDAIVARRKQTFRSLSAKRGSTVQPLMLIVAEVKEFGPTKFGHKAILKHVPDTALMIDEKMFTKIGKVFATELAMWTEVDGAHLMLAATATVGPTGLASLKQAVLMCTTKNWIPFDTGAELELIDALTAHHRTFVRSLRYNLRRSVPIAAAVLTDTAVDATGLYIADTAAGDDPEPIEEVAQASALPSWIWNTAEPLPPLPSNARHPERTDPR